MLWGKAYALYIQICLPIWFGLTQNIISHQNQKTIMQKWYKFYNVDYWIWMNVNLFTSIIAVITLTQITRWNEMKYWFDCAQSISKCYHLIVDRPHRPVNSAKDDGTFKCVYSTCFLDTLAHWYKKKRKKQQRIRHYCQNYGVTTIDLRFHSLCSLPLSYVSNKY